MFNKTELTEKLTAELRELAKNEGIANAGDLRKNDLIEQLLNKGTIKNAPTLKEAKTKIVKEGVADKPKAGKRVRIISKEIIAEPEPERPTLFDEPKTNPTPVILPHDFVDDPNRLETIAAKLQNKAKK